jgi:hypothetical protein
MNSTQLNFFIVPSDWPAIMEFLNSYDIKLINEPILNPQSLKLLSVNSNAERQYPKTLILTHSSFHEYLFFDYKEGTNSYSINRLKSYILEFSPGGFFPNDQYTLHRGRFYCVTRFYATNGEQIEKSRDFLDWAKRINKSFKKQFLMKNGDEKIILFSHETMKWIHEKRGQIDTAYLKIKFSNGSLNIH